MKVIKKMFKEILGLILIQFHSGYNSENKILSIYFHNPTKKVFRKILEWLVNHNYKFISTKELQNFIVQNHKPAGKMVCITFDDAWSKNLELIDLIEEYEVPITVFVPTEAVLNGNYWFEFAKIKGQEKYTFILNKKKFKKLEGEIFEEKVSILKSKYSLPRSCITLEELIELSKNKFITIGSHSVTHPILHMLIPEKQEQELVQSKKILNQWLNTKLNSSHIQMGTIIQPPFKLLKNRDTNFAFRQMLV